MHRDAVQANGRAIMDNAYQLIKNAIIKLTVQTLVMNCIVQGIEGVCLTELFTIFDKTIACL